MRLAVLFGGLLLSQGLFIGALAQASRHMFAGYLGNFVVWLVAFALLDRLGLDRLRRQRVLGGLTLALILVDGACWVIAQGLPDAVYCWSGQPARPGCTISHELATNLILVGLFYPPVALVALVSFLRSAPWRRELLVPEPTAPSVEGAQPAAPQTAARPWLSTAGLALLSFGAALLLLLALLVLRMPGPR